jgi:hypothetical protein
MHIDDGDHEEEGEEILLRRFFTFLKFFFNILFIGRTRAATNIGTTRLDGMEARLEGMEKKFFFFFYLCFY